MSDSFQDIGTITAKWMREPNWIESPKWEPKSNVIVSRYTGTITEILDSTLPIPRQRVFTFTNLTKAQEYEMISFFNTYKGRWQKFWMPSWDTQFEVYETIQNGSSYIRVIPKNFSYAYQGYERIMLLLANGDRIVRKITSVTNGVDYDTLNINTVMDREVAVSNVSLACLFILGRFDMDVLELVHVSDIVSSAVFKFQELVREYP